MANQSFENGRSVLRPYEDGSGETEYPHIYAVLLITVQDLKLPG